MATETGIIKRSVVLSGVKTSVSLENEFWASLHEIAKLRGSTVSDLVQQIAKERFTPNLSSAIRLFVLNHFRSGGASKIQNV